MPQWIGIENAWVFKNKTDPFHSPHDKIYIENTQSEQVLGRKSQGRVRSSED